MIRPKYGDRVVCYIDGIRREATVQAVDNTLLVATDNGQWEWIAFENVVCLI